MRQVGKQLVRCGEANRSAEGEKALTSVHKRGAVEKCAVGCGVADFLLAVHDNNDCEPSEQR
jgi:hypothetical protein